MSQSILNIFLATLCAVCILFVGMKGIDSLLTPLTYPTVTRNDTGDPFYVSHKEILFLSEDTAWDKSGGCAFSGVTPARYRVWSPFDKKYRDLTADQWHAVKIGEKLK